MPTIIQNAKMTITAGFGSAGENLTLGVATQGGRTFYDAGVRDGNSILYVIITGSDMETGNALYTQSGPSLTGRSPSVSTNNNAPIVVNSSSYVMATAIVDSSTNPFAGSVMTSNLDFEPTIHGLRIRGDLSNLSPAYRLGFQTASQDSGTIVPAFPNGSSRVSTFMAESTASGSATAAGFGVSGDEVIISDLTRGGVASPINVYRDGALLVSLDDAHGYAKFYNTLQAITPAFGDASQNVATTQYVQSAIGGVVGLQGIVSGLQTTVASLQSTSAHNGANTDITSLAGLAGSITTSGASGLIQTVDNVTTAFPWNVGTSDGPIYQYVSRNGAGVYKSSDTDYGVAWSFNFNSGVFHTDAVLVTCGSIQTSPGPGLGNVNVGLWGDASNLSLRAPTASGAVFFQDPSGVNTWGWMKHGEIAVVSAGTAGLTLVGNSAATDLYYRKQIISDTGGYWIFRQARPSDNSTIDTFLDQSGGTILTSMNAASTMSPLFAPTNSPSLTGSPLAPTPPAGSNNSRIANTAYVTAALGPYLTSATASATYIPMTGGGFSGPISLSGDPTSALQPATKQYVDAATTLSVGDIAGAAPLSSPFFVGIVGVLGTTNAALRGFVSYQYSSDENGARFVGAKARGTYTVPSSLLADDSIVMLSAVGWGPLDEEWSSSVGYLNFLTAEDWTATANGTRARLAVTPVGTTVPVDALFIEPTGYVGIGASPSYPLDVSGDIRATGYLRGNGSLITGITASQIGGLSSATVTSVGLSLPSIFSVSGSPVTSSGTLAGSLVNQSANVIFAGPSSGAAAQPLFRSLVASDMPARMNATGFSGAITAYNGSVTTTDYGLFYNDGGLHIAAETTTNGGLYISVNAAAGVNIRATPAGSTGIQLFGDGHAIFNGTIQGNGSLLTGLTASQVGGLSASATVDATNATNISSGTLSLARLGSRSANLVLAGPSTGTAASPSFRALVAADIPALAYVTSVGLSVPGVLYSVSGSPITSSGTLAFSLLTQNANTLFAGPSTGAAATPAFRALVAADIPTILSSQVSGLAASATIDATNASNISSGSLSLARLGVQAAHAVLIGPTSGSASPTFRSLVAGDIPALSYVSSVGLSLPSIFSVSGSPITSSGTLSASLATQSANSVFAGPGSGGNAVPSFRGLVVADIPPLPYASLSAGATFTSFVQLSYGTPAFTLTNTAGLLDQKNWRMWAGGGGLTFDILDDTVTNHNTWLQVLRSGYTPTQVRFYTKVGIGSDPAYLLDVRNTTSAAQICLSGSGNDDGSFLGGFYAGGQNYLNMGAGDYFDGTSHIAKTTSPASLIFGAGLLYVAFNSGATVGSAFTPVVVHTLDTTGAYPGVDNSISSGKSSNRWTAVYAVNGTIQTSTQDMKTPLARFTESEISVAKDVSLAMGTFAWLHDPRKRHVGITLQSIQKIMRDHGVNPVRYGFIIGDGMSYAEVLALAVAGLSARLSELEGKDSQ